MCPVKFLYYDNFLKTNDLDDNGVNWKPLLITEFEGN